MPFDRRLNAEAREVVFCHTCSSEWYGREWGLMCPACSGEITEIVTLENDPRPAREGGSDDLGYSSSSASEYEEVYLYIPSLRDRDLHREDEIFSSVFHDHEGQHPGEATSAAARQGRGADPNTARNTNGVQGDAVTDEALEQIISTLTPHVPVRPLTSEQALANLPRKTIRAGSTDGDTDCSILRMIDAIHSALADHQTMNLQHQDPQDRTASQKQCGFSPYAMVAMVAMLKVVDKLQSGRGGVEGHERSQSSAKLEKSQPSAKHPPNKYPREQSKQMVSVIRAIFRRKQTALRERMKAGRST
ncbi:hypothetical protein ACQRIT_002140 [Beauveria bassiana]